MAGIGENGDLCWQDRELRRRLNKARHSRGLPVLLLMAAVLGCADQPEARFPPARTIEDVATDVPRDSRLNELSFYEWSSLCEVKRNLQAQSYPTAEQQCALLAVLVASLADEEDCAGRVNMCEVSTEGSPDVEPDPSADEEICRSFAPPLRSCDLPVGVALDCLHEKARNAQLLYSMLSCDPDVDIVVERSEQCDMLLIHCPEAARVLNLGDD